MNTTPLTPPSAYGSPATPPPPSSRRSWVTPVVGVIGGVVLVVAIAGATFAGIRFATAGDSADSADSAGISELDIESSGAEFTLTYGDVTEAVLDVQGRTGWSLERRGDSLEVRPPVRWIFSWNFGQRETVTLTLPESLRDAGLDADFTLSAGSLRADGAFDSLELEVNAGAARVEGSARTADVEVNAGRTDLVLSDVSSADLTVSAGRMDTELRGAPPSDMEIEVSAGQLNVIVPDVAYAVTSDVSAGSFDNRVQVASSSRRSIHVDVSAGSASVRPGD